MTDSVPNTDQNQENFPKILISELLKKYEIGRDSLYNRMRYLRITTWKVSGKACLDPQQVKYMDDLDEYIRVNKRMEGFPIPEPSGPIEVEEEQTTTLAVAQTQQVTTSTTPNYSTEEQRSQSSGDVENLVKLVESAQNKATGLLIAENLLARQYIENPELLPQHLKDKIKEAGEIQAVDPFAYAQSLVGLAKLAS